MKAEPAGSMSPFSLETASGPLRSGQRVAADNGVVVRKDIETPSLHSPGGEVLTRV
jgi:hypothetical protein